MKRFRYTVLFAALSLTAGCDKGKEDATAGESNPPGENAKDKDADEAQADGAAAANLPSGESILAKAVEAAGGEAKLGAVQSFYYEGQIVIAGQNIGGDVKLWWKGGDFYLENNMVGIGQVRSGKQGDVIWSEDPILGLRKLSGPEAEQHVWASSLLLAAEWKKYFDKAETVKEHEVDGKKVYDVKLTTASGADVTMTFDADTSLQVGQKFQQINPMGKMPVEVKLSDYRDVEGIKVAFKQEIGATLATATQEITKLEVNVDVDETKFAMPTSGAAVVKSPAAGGGAKADGKAHGGMPMDADGKPGKAVPPKK